MRDYRDAKAMAKALRLALAEDGVAIAHTRALEIVARQFDTPNWNVLAARIERKDAASGIALTQAIPILRIFDLAKAREFYLDFLGFAVDWEHRFSADAPIYLQVSRQELKLHLSEHAGDASPGGSNCVYVAGLKALHAELAAKAYPYMRPGLETIEGRTEMVVTDPFSNRIRFMELD